MKREICANIPLTVEVIFDNGYDIGFKTANPPRSQRFYFLLFLLNVIIKPTNARSNVPNWNINPIASATDKMLLPSSK